MKDKNVTFKYVALPTEKLPDDFKTYSVKVYGSNLRTSGLSASNLAKDISMDGFKRLSGGDGNYGHLRISVYTGWPKRGDYKLESKTETKKDKEGNETKTTKYWYEFPFSSVGYYYVYDPEGVALVEESVTTNKVLKTSSYKSAADLRKKFRSLLADKKKAFAKEATNDVVRAAKNLITERYDFNQTAKQHKLYWVKKHSTEKDFSKHLESAKALAKSVNAETSAADLKAKLRPAIDFWKKVADETPADDKKLKRVYKAANHNLAVVHYYLDDFDAATQYAEAVIASEGKDGRAKGLLKKIKASQALMELHGVNTMHYVRNVADAIAPAKVKALEEMKEEIAENNNTATGYIYINGEKITGSIAQKKEASELFFGENGNTTFIVDTGSELREYDLTHEDITAFAIGERSFIKVNFQPSAKGKSEVKKHIMEELYTSDKINLLKYYPTTGSLSEEKAEFAFQKKADDQPVSLLSTQFLILKKGLANYFSDCGDLEEMCSAG
ncbi:MAG: hypothetical protein AAGJ18_21675, partial [Bacteroidota bacterium]